jgi:phosphate transport system protein
MGKLVLSHLHQVLDAYATGETSRAVGVWERDDDVDEHYNALFRELVQAMADDKQMIGPGAHLLFVAKNLERIGDHATNIAEVIHYLVTGREIASERPRGPRPETS